jgi:hypothetical protein
MLDILGKQRHKSASTHHSVAARMERNVEECSEVNNTKAYAINEETMYSIFDGHYTSFSLFI